MLSFIEMVAFSIVIMLKYIDQITHHKRMLLLMQARLGFAIATMVRQDILVVDEILSVGDYQFQQKCYERMGQMLSGGTTLLYVSHDINSVRQLCDHAIWIDKGNVRMSGLVEEVTTEYMHMNQ